MLSLDFIREILGYGVSTVLLIKVNKSYRRYNPLLILQGKSQKFPKRKHKPFISKDNKQQKLKWMKRYKPESLLVQQRGSQKRLMSLGSDYHRKQAITGVCLLG